MQEIRYEKLILLRYPKKCGDIADEILDAGINAEQTFKYRWPKKGVETFDYIHHHFGL